MLYRTNIEQIIIAQMFSCVFAPCAGTDKGGGK